VSSLHYNTLTPDGREKLLFLTNISQPYLFISKLSGVGLVIASTRLDKIEEVITTER